MNPRKSAWLLLAACLLGVLAFGLICRLACAAPAPLPRPPRAAPAAAYEEPPPLGHFWMRWHDQGGNAVFLADARGTPDGTLYYLWAGTEYASRWHWAAGTLHVWDAAGDTPPAPSDRAADWEVPLSRMPDGTLAGEVVGSRGFRVVLSPPRP